MLKRVPIGLKLLLLAGVPVIGALILAASIARESHRQADAAAALGSIEDLARLSAHMSSLVHELQFERNAASWQLANAGQGEAELRAQFAATDAARRTLEDFLASRSTAAFPPRLSRDLGRAQSELQKLESLRPKALVVGEELGPLLAYYKGANRHLISATAALAQIGDDGELMRAISALVSLLEVKERASQEHALLSYVFSASSFPPGSYKEFVTLITEEQDYIDVLELTATDAVSERFRAEFSGADYEQASDYRKVALETMDDNFQVPARSWSEVQARRIARLRGLEVELNRAVEAAALAKVSEAQRSLRLSYGLGASVVVLSALLAGLVGTGISRSIRSLSQAAEQVRRERDFGVRAEKLSDDELGALTTAFNEMLAGIQERDEELRHHRENLEQLVQERTLALQKRNEAMRLVLDNVEQGLVTIERDGRLSSERSRAFDEWFGGPAAPPTFDQQIAKHNENVRATLRLAWEQVTDGFLPLDVALEQMPKHIEVGSRHYALGYRAILDENDFHGVLLVVSDITAEIERMRHDAEQREIITVFERAMKDRSGFIEFFQECEALVRRIVRGEVADAGHAMRLVHTVKGNSAIFGVGSVAEVAHRLETNILEHGQLPSLAELEELSAAWGKFAERVQRLVGTAEEPIVEVAYEELENLIRSAALGVPHRRMAELLERLKYERVAVRLRRSAQQAEGLAQRLGKGEVTIRVEAGSDVRLPAERWGGFWSAFVHVVRNAVDHGLERPEERVAQGKREAELAFKAWQDERELTIEVSDNGRGIDWQKVRDRARERGLPHQSHQDLVNALFADGVSTAKSVTDTSGRGVGLGAVKEATLALGGEIRVESQLGSGTAFRFVFPLREATRPSTKSRYPGARPSLLPARAPSRPSIPAV